VEDGVKWWGASHVGKGTITWKLESGRKPIEVYPGNFIYYKLLHGA
jgi:hypothetical protein